MNQTLGDINAKRIADDPIYLNEDRYTEPKEIHKFLAKEIAKWVRPEDKDLLDIGCATGELVYHLMTLCPELTYTGTDVSEDMLGKARKMVPAARFDTASITDPSFFQTHKFDHVVACGVLSIFDDQKIPLYNMLDALRPGGCAYILTPLNDDPIDMVTRYRRPDKSLEQWELGWNIFSKFTYKHLLENYGEKLEYEFVPYQMPFAVEKQADPMRTWTIPVDKTSHHLINGACQMIKMNVVKIKKQS